MFPLPQLPRNLDAALRDAGHAKESVRLSAMKDLARHAAEAERSAVIEALSHALRDDVSVAVRGAAALAIADASAKRGLPAALDAVARDTSSHVRELALVAIGEVANRGDPDALAAIESGLRDSAPGVRFQALLALRSVQGQAALEVALSHSTDSDSKIRWIALRIAEEICDDGGAADDVLGRVRAALGDEAPEVRLAAAIFLARRSTKGEPIEDADLVEAKRQIAEAVQSDAARFDADDVQTAIDLSGELGITTALRGLQRHAWGRLGLGGGNFAWNARIALARLGDARANKALLAGLDAWLVDDRNLAVVAVGKARLVEARPLLEAMRRADRADAEALAIAIREIDGFQGR